MKTLEVLMSLSLRAFGEREFDRARPEWTVENFEVLRKSIVLEAFQIGPFDPSISGVLSSSSLLAIFAVSRTLLPRMACSLSE